MEHLIICSCSMSILHESSQTRKNCIEGRKKVLNKLRVLCGAENRTTALPKKLFSRPENMLIATAGPKKRTFRSLWILRLNAALRDHGEKYSTFIKKLSDKKIEIDRKVLSQMAVKYPEQFEKFVEFVK